MNPTKQFVEQVKQNIDALGQDRDMQDLRWLKAEGRKASDGLPLELEIDKSIEHKLLITVAPDGYLKRV